MRSVLSISLTEKQKKEIEKRAKKVGTNTSSYILHAVALEKELISEDDLLEMAKKSEKDYKLGKTKKLSSLADLV